MTDITGFGLLGHAHEVAKASRISLRIDHRTLPILPGAADYSHAGLCSTGLTSNREFYGPDVRLGDSVPAEVQDIVFDPQTSGGILIFCQSEDAAPLLRKLQAQHIGAVEIGTAGEPTDGCLIECV